MHLSPEAGKLWFRVVVFLIIVSLVLLFVVPSGTGAFIATVLSLAISLLFLVVLIVAIRLSNK